MGCTDHATTDDMFNFIHNIFIGHSDNYSQCITQSWMAFNPILNLHLEMELYALVIEVMVCEDTVSSGPRGRPGGSQRGQTGCSAGTERSSPGGTG